MAHWWRNSKKTPATTANNSAIKKAGINQPIVIKQHHILTNQCSNSAQLSHS